MDERWMQAAFEAAFAGGAVVRDAAVSGVRFKGAVDPVTEVDLASEAAIREVLAARTPDVPLVAEESATGELPDTCWIVDPLDGTVNFLHGFPPVAVSVALQVAGQVELGCVLDVYTSRLYTAGRGQGAACDGVPLRVSKVSHLESALLGSGFGYDRRQRAEFYLAYVKAFLERGQGFRRDGSAAIDLCRVAAGQLDGFWEFGLKCWDVAAGSLIVAEAGGRVSGADGGPLDLSAHNILATNGHIHAEMLAVLAEVTARVG